MESFLDCRFKKLYSLLLELILLYRNHSMMLFKNGFLLTGLLLYHQWFHFVVFQGLSNDLKRSPETLEDLKFVLSVIASIRDMQLNVELRIFDIQEQYRTLAMYDIEVREINCVFICSISLGTFKMSKKVKRVIVESVTCRAFVCSPCKTFTTQ